MDTTRIDKWLWAARFFKTRSLATDAVERGKVKLRGERTKPSHNLKTGDMLQIDNGATEWEVQVCGISDKRGSAAVAQGLYGETAASVEKRRLLAEQHHFFKEPTATLKGRPTKRDRRLLDQSSS
ncbi:MULTISPECIES: RNA-binding S4 domain-containing protein [unclassified Herbaspirillum]|uniref:RNA-binding S4 domain-containing protein n=1 Tax=unclassified Herbaspirillum TaxID=2624150 RepID=UPI000E2EA29D|nr:MULTISPECIES: RNA-binding S4 domain-containing protein [unclassified Herbaspirillum]RFB65557.1 RNA-binding S4 domain-containing protein [Herbaspirillum sp. 3R-3a1]TFI08184.1 RNA-binding S4 domain-containing protein [Herbaspirillum sp. 3R11]TFI14599.1 RNA-binding S4 domain-containing protein [Herbaspirillum sp. 3R-11]TFI24672.1 RNA-binding S4 domain-containing protein [Herbaspirillum sp. 3C11]